MPALTAAAGRGGGRVLTGEEGKDSDAILGHVYKIISSFNWRVKSSGQNKITQDQEEEDQKGSVCWAHLNILLQFLLFPPCLCTSAFSSFHLSPSLLLSCPSSSYPLIPMSPVFTGLQRPCCGLGGTT